MRPLASRSLGAATFIVLAMLFVALTVVLDRGLRGARLDLTANRLYTLAPGTNHLVRGLKEPVNLYFYFSQQASVAVPQLRAYAGRVRELLEEIAARSGGRVRLQVVDPQPYSDDEDRATELGLKGVPLGAGDDPIWFGLAGSNSTDGRAVIDFFQPQKEEFLEYDVARLIHQLATSARKVVGVLSTLPLGGGFDPATGAMQRPWISAAQVSELFEVRTIAPDASALPPGLDALLVVQPKGLSPALSYAIDQYVLGGGRLLLCVDPDAQLDSGASAGTDRASTFEPMLAAWGVGYDPRQALGDLEHALMVAGTAGAQPERHLAFAAFGEGSLAKSDVITSSLGTINFATPGFLEPRPVAGVRFDALITSGAQSAPIPTAMLHAAVTPEALRQGFKPTGRRYVVAARVSGLLPSAFPTGPPAGVDAAARHLVRAVRPANLVVVADTDFLADLMWVRTTTVFGERVAEPWANNGDFVLNALDNLTGSADLLGIRGRPIFSRPFTRVDRLRTRADERLRGKAAELEARLADTERKLAALQNRREDRQALTLSPEQQREVDRFRQQKIEIRKQLRAVRRDLDEQIDALGTRLKAINVVAMPVVVSLFALATALFARRRRRARGDAA